MSPTPRCPDCDAPLPPDSPRGLCPNCLLGAALSWPGQGSAAAMSRTATFSPVGSLAVLEETMEGLPRVLLRDSEGVSGVDAVVQPASTEMPAPADRSAHLHLFGEIARGGMGAILKGRDVDLGRDLAVKVLLEKHRDHPELVRRFVEEAQIAGQLQHPGIVPVYELGAFADRRPYFAMKLVKGRTLATVLAGRADPAEGRMDLLATLLQVAQTVAFAHARGVIHRDLKPSNVMVGSFGEVQVMDWGLAKVLPRGGAADDADAGRLDVAETIIATARSGSDWDHSHAGSVMGTPAYMAPEQARGEVEAVDERADVFALGSILCEVVTGRPAFTGRNPGEVQRTAALGDLADAFARLDACGADAELIALARECLARERDDRPRDASAVVERLGGYLASIERLLRAAELERAAEAARAVEARARVAVERSRRRFQVGLAAALLLLTALGGLGSAYLLRQRYEHAARFAQVFTAAATLHDKARRQPGDPALWRDALAALERAEGQGHEGEVTALRDKLQTGLDGAERVARLRQKLVEVRANQQDIGAAGTDAAYAAAFRDAGLDLDQLGPAEFAERLEHQPGGAVVELAAFLDDWSAARREAKRPAATWRRSLAAARRADPDPYRDRLRAALLAEDRTPQAAALQALAAAPEAADLPAATAVLLGRALADLGRAEAAVALLRPAAGRFPGDVWVNYALAEALLRLRPAAREEAVQHYTAARALRPETAHELAHLLQRLGRGAEAEAVFVDLTRRRPENARYLVCLGRHVEERGPAAAAAKIFERAIAVSRATIRNQPDLASAHYNLGNALEELEKHDEAAAEYRAAIRLKPDYTEAYNNLGNALTDQGKLDEAAAEYRTAIRLRPDDAGAHGNLGFVYVRQGKLDEAVTEHRLAVRLKPGDAKAHSNLGAALGQQGKLDEAVAEFRAAIRLRPDLALAHVGLGLALRGQGDYAGSLAMLRKGHELGSKRPDWPFPSAQAVREAERLAALAGRLPAVLRGDDRPRDNADRLALAQVCYDTKRYAAAARLWAEALAADPKLDGDRRAQHRYNAACAAALAAAGQGKDDPPPDDAARAKLRGQGLVWLKAELAVWSKLSETAGKPNPLGRLFGVVDRDTIRDTLRHWKADPDLAGIRDAKALEALPEAERADWRALWGEVDRLLKTEAK